MTWAAANNNTVVPPTSKIMKNEDLPHFIYSVARQSAFHSPPGAAVRDALLELTGDPFHLLVCGRGRSLKDDTREPW